MECRNTKVRSSGMLAAMIPKKANRKGTATPKPGKVMDCELVIVQGIRHCISTNSFFLSVHIWKKTGNLLNFRNQNDLETAICRNFTVNQEIPLHSVQLIYLNAILGNPKLLRREFREDTLLAKNSQEQPISPSIQECSLKSCDVWFSRPIFGFKTITLGNQVQRYRRRTKFSTNKKKKIERVLPWSFQNEPTDLFIVTSKFKPFKKIESTATAAARKFFLLPYRFPFSDVHKKEVVFAPITKVQLEKLRQCSPLTPKQYRQLLKKFCRFNGTEKMVKVIRIVPGLKHSSMPRGESVQNLPLKLDHNSGGSIVTHYQGNDSQSIPLDAVETSVEGIFHTVLRKNKSDVGIGNNCVTVFRGYRWPYETKIPDNVFELLASTYSKKGLLRNCVDHLGNFEMIGKRTSNQSTGSMCAKSGNTINHEYNRTSMDSSLQPLVRSIVNSLQHEALNTAYSSGESLMSLSRNILGKASLKDQCSQTIITQKHFCNTVHRDECFFNEEESSLVYQCPRLEENEKRYLSYLKEFTFPNERIPKSTTCCWLQRKQCTSKSRMIQYFVSPSSGFGYDLSSELLKRMGSVGATFQSSLMEHCTSVPIWIDKSNLINLEAIEIENYNFAWGSNGKSA